MCTLWLESSLDKGRHPTYLVSLRYASDAAEKYHMSVLIEPLSPFDMPGYFLRIRSIACELLETLNLANVKLMFDIYHVGRTEGQVIERFNSCLPLLGHVQFASVPDRGPPDHGAINFDSIFNAIDRSGWFQPLGAEYKISGSTEDTLGWMQPYKQTKEPIMKIAILDDYFLGRSPMRTGNHFLI